ncbi:hypothetical protein HDU96_009799 [Phlyctochytrium bullatum]|nr:hypothetical protein HDU96_009799 [Phlyctochytrium bullatum]
MVPDFRRELVLNTFLEIPQEICFEMYAKFRFERTNHIGASSVDDGFSDTTSDTGGENSDSDEEGEDANKLVIYENSSSRFDKIVSSYTFALVYFTKKLSVKDVLNPAPTSFLKGVLMSEIEAFEGHRYALMYGNSSLGLPSRKLSPAERDFFFGNNYLNNTKSLDSLSNDLINDVKRLLNLPSFTKGEPAYGRVLEYSPLVSLLSTKIMFPLTLFFLLFTYFKLFRKILRMIMDEAQKTTRLVLLIPLTWVSKIPNVKNVLNVDAQELDIAEIKAFIGNAEDKKIEDIIEKHLYRTSSRERSVSEPVQGSAILFDGNEADQSEEEESLYCNFERLVKCEEQWE